MKLRNVFKNLPPHLALTLIGLTLVLIVTFGGPVINGVLLILRHLLGR
jgi:hypothetical protein